MLLFDRLLFWASTPSHTCLGWGWGLGVEVQHVIAGLAFLFHLFTSWDDFVCFFILLWQSMLYVLCSERGVWAVRKCLYREAKRPISRGKDACFAELKWRCGVGYRAFVLICYSVSVDEWRKFGSAKTNFVRRKTSGCKLRLAKHGDKRGACLTNIKGVRIAQLLKNVHVFFLFVHF